jgi:hypothetical protein
LLSIVPGISGAGAIMLVAGGDFFLLLMKFLKTERIRVSSSNLQSVGYASESSILEIKFNSGGIYQYSRVPAAVHQGLMNAASHGKYFHAFIKNVYSYQKVR